MSNYGTNFRAPKVDVHSFSMIPRADIPRSKFRMQHQHKTTFSASNLIPFYVQEILPGDTFSVNMTAFCRLATPLYPIMDNMDLETWFFFVPNRLVWKNWYKFMGEQENPSDSISFAIPQVVSPAGGFAQKSLYDYMGIPCVGQINGGATISINALPVRAYAIIFNQWFRDENLTSAMGYGSGPSTGICSMDDGPDLYTNYVIQQVAKRPDYFTKALPWTQKSTSPVTLPLGTSAPIKTQATEIFTGAGNAITWRTSAGGVPATGNTHTTGAAGVFGLSATAAAMVGNPLYPTNLYADLSAATSATINSIRLAFQTQRLLERDARGGTRYTEIIRSHFGVVSPDARLQRPEYLGGGKTPLTIAPVPQTTATGLTGGTSPLGTLSGVGTTVNRAGFRQSFTEHGYILGLCAVRRDPIYQQGLRKLWSRSTRYDFYLPVFAALGEQAVLNKEIYMDGSANDNLTFAFQERWAEYRFTPSRTSGFFNSRSTTTLDAWHLAQNFASLPALNGTFVADETNVVLRRALAAGVAADNQQILADFFIEELAARPMPMYSVPGLVDHF